MTGRIVGSTCVAALLAATVTAAQVGGQTPTQSPVRGNSQQTPGARTTDRAATPQAQTDQQITVTGCVQREGASDFVLASAMPSGTSGNVSGGVTGSTSTEARGTSGSAAGSSTSGIGTTGAATAGAAGLRYRLSGERDLVEYVGQRVEIVGRTDAGAPSGTSNASSASTGIGSTSGARPEATGSPSGAGAPGSTPGGAGAGASTPGAGNAGSTASGAASQSDRSNPNSASGATSDSTRGATTGAGSRGIAGQTAAMQHITITSVRAVGGSCQ